MKNIWHLLILASTVIVCVWISAFASLVYVPVGIKRFTVGLKIRVITAGIKKYKGIIKKKKKKHDKMALLGKTKLNTNEILISKVLIEWCISHEEFVSVNNVLRQYNKIKEEIENSKSSVENTI